MNFSNTVHCEQSLLYTHFLASIISRSDMDSNHFWTYIRRVVPSWIAGRVPARRVLRRLLRILLVITAIPLILQVFLAYFVGQDARLFPPALQRAKNLLIITAHPDDECLFFAPSILGVLDRNPDTVGGLLVLSTGQLHSWEFLFCKSLPHYWWIGNKYGIGEARKEELKGSCDALGINGERCVVLDRPDIQDSPTVWWNEDIIIGLAREYVEKWDVDAVSLSPFERWGSLYQIKCWKLLVYFLLLLNGVSITDNYILPWRCLWTRQS
jgi:hypothetical protein